jgi:ABC-2 type transport system permease protein
MENVRTIFRREFAAYFNSTIAYIFLIVFLVLTCLLYMTSFFLSGEASMRGYFDSLPLFLCIFIPLLSMRLWADDKQAGTFELLMTLPMRSAEVVAGKYLAAMVFYLLALAGTLPIVVMLTILGNPDLGAVFSGYIGAILLGALFMGVGIFCSGLVRDQLSAAVLGVLACFALFLPGIPTVAATIDGWIKGLGSFLQQFLGLFAHYESLQLGALYLGDAAYFLTLTLVFLILNTLWLEGRTY